MNTRNAKQKPVALLLLLAMLTLCVATVLPVVASAADPAGITDFSYQTPAGATLSDDSVDLRFLFKIDTLDGYEKVGFVFSKSNDAPTVGGEHCGVYETTSAYSAINAGGEPQEAGEGLWWVAVKLTGIPKASFDETIYVVGYVKAEGEDPIYTDVRALTVCDALGHDYGAWTQFDADAHKKTCAICGDVATEGHNFSMTVSEGVATYTCVTCGYSYQTNVNTTQFETVPSLGKFSIQDSAPAITKAMYDSDGDTVDDCIRTTMTNTTKKYWLNYTNANPTYTDGTTNVISFKTDIRFASGATPADNGDLFWFYYAFSGNASGSNDQGYGFRFREIDGKIRMRAFGKETGTPTYGIRLDYDTWYSIRLDVTATTSGSTHTLRSIRVYVDDQLVHSVDLADLNYSSYSTNKVRMMLTGISGATETFDIKNVGVFVGSVQ